MSYADKNIVVLVNPTRENERALKIGSTISSLLIKKKIQHHLFTAQWPIALDDFTEAWIVGGDGTMNWFANAYSDTQLPLSIFGGGTGNDFHWMLYGDMKVDQQVELILHASPKKTDAGICNGKLFLNGVGIGFDGAIVKDLVGKKKLAGKASYLLSILKHIVGYHEKPCVIEMNGESLQEDCFMISVANAKRYGGGFLVAPNAVVTDGVLDVNIVGRISPLKRIKYLPVIEKGEHLSLPFIRYEQAGEIKISGSQKLHAHIDGEYLYEAVYEIKILPGRFSFLC